MRVALVLTGLLRGWEDAYPAIKHCFMDKWNADVFISIWDEVGWYTGKGYTHTEADQFISTSADDKGFHVGEQVDANALLRHFDPQILRIEKFTDMEPKFKQRAASFKNAYTRPQNTIAQAYKKRDGVRLVSYAEYKYDVIVRMRPDLVLAHDPTYIDLEEVVSNGLVYTLPSRNKIGTGTGDSLMIGGASAVEMFTEFHYANLEFMYDKSEVSCPHIFVATALATLNGIEHRELQVDAHVSHSPSGIPYAEPDVIL